MFYFTRWVSMTVFAQKIEISVKLNIAIILYYVKSGHVSVLTMNK